jgi:hypothetical protein
MKIQSSMNPSRQRNFLTMKKQDQDKNRSRWFLPAVVLSVATGLIGCETTGSSGNETPMTNEYGDPIGSSEDEKLQMEEKMQNPTELLTPTF